MGDRGVPRAEDGLAPGRRLVVCLHGLGPAGPDVFAEATQAWQRDFRVLAPPMPGWAGTHAAERDDYLPSALARRVEELAGGEPFFAVGFSWGGTVALRLDPRRLLGVVLVDVGYQTYDEPPPTYEELLARFADVDFAPPEAAAAGMWGVHVEPAAEALDSLAEVPTLLLAATEPRVERRAADLEAFRAALPHAEVQVVDGAEHDVLGTAPATAIPSIHAWLRRVDASSR
jgi:pimeloyl-ACP methyl ester carboxylesterase